MYEELKEMEAEEKVFNNSKCLLLSEKQQKQGKCVIGRYVC